MPKASLKSLIANNSSEKQAEKPKASKKADNKKAEPSYQPKFIKLSKVPTGTSAVFEFSMGRVSRCKASGAKFSKATGWVFESSEAALNFAKSEDTLIEAGLKAAAKQPLELKKGTEDVLFYDVEAGCYWLKIWAKPSFYSLRDCLRSVGAFYTPEHKLWKIPAANHSDLNGQIDRLCELTGLKRA